MQWEPWCLKRNLKKPKEMVLWEKEERAKEILLKSDRCKAKEMELWKKEEGAQGTQM